MAKFRRYFFILLPLLIFSTLLIAMTLAYSQNNLFNNDNWIVGKRMGEVHLLGGDDFILNRSSIARGELNLGGQWGFQKVTTRRSFDLAEISFGMKLSKRSYLTVLLEDGSSEPVTVGLSSDEQFISGQGERIFPADKWLDVQIKIKNQELLVKVDGEPLRVRPLSGPVRGPLSFWGSFRPAYLRNIKLKNVDGSEFAENFQTPLSPFIGLAFTFVLLVIVVMGVIARLLKAPVILVQASAVILLTVITGIGFAFDWHYWSRLELNVFTTPINSKEAQMPARDVEKLRVWIFAQVAKLVGYPEPSRELLASKGYPRSLVWKGPILCPRCESVNALEVGRRWGQSPSKRIRIIFSGSSQTVGAGATDLDHSLVGQVSQQLADQIKIPIEVLNIAVSGAKAHQQYLEYKYNYAFYKPDLAVLVWGANDSPESLRQGLNEFISLNRKNRIPMLLVVEMQAYEIEFIIETETRNALLHIAEEFEVPVYNLNAEFSKLVSPNTKFIWWDVVHLTDAGQKMAAQLLAPRIMSELERLGVVTKNIQKPGRASRRSMMTITSPRSRSESQSGS